MAAVTPFRTTRKSFPSPAERPSSDMPLGVEGFRYRELFEPARLRDLYDVFCTELKAAAPDVAASYEAYRTCQGAGMTPEQCEHGAARRQPARQRVRGAPVRRGA